MKRLGDSMWWIAALALSLPVTGQASSAEAAPAEAAPAAASATASDGPSAAEAVEADTSAASATGPTEVEAAGEERSNVFGPKLPPVGSPALALPGADSRSTAPNFTMRTLSGQRVKLSDYKGKVVILSFWATWCAPCKQELPVLQGLLDRHEKDGLVVLAINTDDPKTVAEVRRFVADRKLTMPIPLDGDNKVLGRFNPRHALPFLQILDHEGRRTFQHTGFTSGAEKILEDQVLALLAEKPTTVATP